MGSKEINKDYMIIEDSKTKERDFIDLRTIFKRTPMQVSILLLNQIQQ